MLIWLLALLCLTGSAQADVTRKHTVSSQFMGANEGTTADYYTADKQATESTLRWTRGFMKTATGGKPTDGVNIVRLDKEVVWTLDPKKKTYTEMTFAQFKEQMKKGMEEAKQAEDEQEVADSAREDLYTWTTEDQSVAESKTINGWVCKNAKFVATGVNKQDANDKVIITVDMWNSPDVPGKDEIMAFSERYVKALGLDVTALTPGLTSAAMLYQKQMQGAIEAAKKAPGEPVKSLIEIKRHALQGPSLGKAMKEGAANELMGKMPFGKKKAPKEEAPTYVDKIKFSTTSELTEATQTTVEAAKFDIPAGFKKDK